MKMNYHNITYPDMNNGDGLRVVLWVSGCHNHCPGCQNPQTWSPNSGILFDDDARSELFEQLSKDYISGVTLSGGDPLALENLNCILQLVSDIKEKYPDKTIWIYSGYTWEEIWDETLHYQLHTMEKLLTGRLRRQLIVSKCDVMVDGRYEEGLRDVTLKWKGSSNQRVIDVKETLKNKDIVLIIS